MRGWRRVPSPAIKTEKNVGQKVHHGPVSSEHGPVVGVTVVVFQIPVTGSWTRPRVAPTRPRGQPPVNLKNKNCQ